MRLRARAAVAVVALAAVAVLAACSRSSAITQDAPTTPSGAKAVASPSPSAGTGGGAVAEPTSAEAGHEAGVRVVMAGQDSDALSVVRTERLRAKADGRVLVVYAGAGWCEPCKRFKRAIETGALDDKLAKTTLLVFDADRDSERLASAGYKFRFIPYVGLPGGRWPSDRLGRGARERQRVVARADHEARGMAGEGPVSDALTPRSGGCRGERVVVAGRNERTAQLLASCCFAREPAILRAMSLRRRGVLAGALLLLTSCTSGPKRAIEANRAEVQVNLDRAKKSARRSPAFHR